MNWPQRFQNCRFKDGGRSYEESDCWGFPFLAYRDFLDIQLEENAISAERLHEVAVAISAGMGVPPFQTEIPLGKAQAFDLLVMSGRVKIDGRNRRRAVHVGVMTGPFKVLHIEDGSGVLHERISALTIKPRIMGLFRHEALL